MIWPDWQYPHCGTWRSIQAFCNGCCPSGSSPSIVVTSAPATKLTGVMQERVGRPPTCTVQAPHMPMPQPNFVPVRPITSRMTHNRGVSSSASTVTARPLIRNEDMLCLPRRVSLRAAVLPPDSRHLLFKVRPSRQAGAGSPQVGGNASDIAFAERVLEPRHNDARHAFFCTDSTQNHLDQVAGVGQVHRAIERQVGADGERFA